MGGQGGRTWCTREHPIFVVGTWRSRKSRFSPSGGYLESIACTIPSRLAFIRFMQDYLRSYRPFGRIFFIHLYNLIRKGCLSIPVLACLKQVLKLLSPSGGYLESIACTISSRLAFIRFMQDYLRSYRPFGRIFFIHLYNLIR